MKKLLIALLTLGLAFPCIKAGTAEQLIDTSGLYKQSDLETTYDASAVMIEFSEGQAAIKGAGAQFEGSTLTITKPGVYVLSGVLEGQIIIDAAKEDKIRLVLGGLDVTSPEGPALYVLSADKVTVTLKEGSQNSLTDERTLVIAEDDTISAALYSKDDLTINGAGALTVTGAVSNGIICKNDLIIAGGQITVNAVNDAIRGKDSVVLVEGSLMLTAGGDAIESSETDSGKGNVTILSGVINAVTGGGAENAQVKTNGDRMGFGRGMNDAAGQSAEETASQKGVKAAGTLLIYGGFISLNAADDALHADCVTVNGGEITISSGDDGIHADDTLTITDGKIAINRSYEGLEGANILISGGDITLTASDDGVNAAGGNDGSGMVNGRFNDMFAAGEYQVSISGGSLRINAGGDGLDSNGNITISGGETYVSGPTDSGNGALDYNGEFSITGGVLFAAGSSGMMQNVSDAEGQAALLVYLSGSQTAGTEIRVQDNNGNTILSFTPEKNYECVLVSAPELQLGNTYSVLCGESVAASVQLTSSVMTEGSGGGMSGGRGGMRQGGFERQNRGAPTMEGEDTLPHEMPEGDWGMPPEMPEDGFAAPPDRAE